MSKHSRESCEVEIEIQVLKITWKSNETLRIKMMFNKTSTHIDDLRNEEDLLYKFIEILLIIERILRIDHYKTITRHVL